MRISFTFGADLREAQGKGASRRLRHSGKVPAILYGGHKEAQALILDQQNLLTMISNERFYSSIVQLKINNGTQQEAIVKDVQMHPARNVVVHVDLLRVVENEPIRINLPIHFKGESVSPGVKTQGGIVSHMRADVEVVALPKDLPEFLEIDMSAMSLNETKFLADLPLPPGVSIPELAHRNAPVVSIHSPRVEEPEPTAEAAATPAEGAAATAAAPAAGGDAKKGDAKAEAAPAKKEGGKK
jgi:large subunit ribosomal protein L25